jgi:uncharacterized membrane protein YvbJ
MTPCSECGAQTDEGDLFCHKCGAKIAAPKRSTTPSDTEVIKPTDSKKKKSFWRS